MDNIPFGIWILEKDGISCTERIHRYSFIGNQSLNNIEHTEIGSVWEFPVHFARKNWTTPGTIQDLMTVLAAKRTLLEIDQQPDIDQRTWKKVLKIFNERGL